MSESTTEPTPGDWEMSPDFNEITAQLGTVTICKYEREADGRLLAASKKMLAALYEVSYYLNWEVEDPHTAAWQSTAEAVEEALGLARLWCDGDECGNYPLPGSRYCAEHTKAPCTFRGCNQPPLPGNDLCLEHQHEEDMDLALEDLEEPA